MEFKPHVVSFAFATSLFFAFLNGFSQTGPAPAATFSKGGVSINAYDFESFEPFLKKANDTTYVINFWATWCAPCVAELPNFEKLAQAYKTQKIKVLLVSLDSKKQVETSLLPFVKKKNLRSDCVLLSDPDMNAWIPKVDSDWSGALPATLIYNASRHKRQFYERSFTYGELEAEVKSFIL